MTQRASGFCDAEYSYGKSAAGHCERIAGHPPPHAQGEHAETLDYEHEMRMRLVTATERQADALENLVLQLERTADVLGDVATRLEDMGQVED